LADRANEDCRATYNPAYSVAETVEAITEPHDLNQVQRIDPTEATGTGDIGVANAPADLQQLTRMDRFKELAEAEAPNMLH
jgi:hypothetical protein